MTNINYCKLLIIFIISPLIKCNDGCLEITSSVNIENLGCRSIIVSAKTITTKVVQERTIEPGYTEQPIGTGTCGNKNLSNLYEYISITELNGSQLMYLEGDTIDTSVLKLEPDDHRQDYKLSVPATLFTDCP